MGLGYEGWIKVDDKFALGTGASVPRVRPRIESAAGYGGQISTPVEEMGLGLPYNYDYDVYDGSLGFEGSIDFLKDVIIDWLFDRQASKEVQFSTRNGSEQRFDLCFWNNISLTSSPEAAIDGSLQFVALTRDVYTFGDDEMTKLGNYPAGSDATTALCPDVGYPPQLNEGNLNLNPIPGWNTKITIDGTEYEFLNWSLSFSQDVVKFFVCEANTTAQEPKYLAVGPMTVVFSGQYMYNSGFLGDHIEQMEVTMGDPAVGDYTKLALKRMESSTENDDMQPPDGIATLDVEYQVYELELL